MNDVCNSSNFSLFERHAFFFLLSAYPETTWEDGIMDTVQPYSKNLKQMYSALGIVPWVIALVCGCQLFGQLGPLSVGVKGGIPISSTSGVPAVSNDCGSTGCSQFSNYSSRTTHFTLGPALELRLPRGFALEADGLHSRLTYDEFRFTISPGLIYGMQVFDNQSFFRSIKLERWQFPILLKWRFGNRRVRPFVSGGISVDHISRMDEQFKSIVHSSFCPPLTNPCPAGIYADTFSDSGLLPTRNRKGGVLSGGIDFRAFGPIRLTAEARYTRWGSSQFTNANLEFDFLGSSPVISLNEVTFLLGVSFGK